MPNETPDGLSLMRIVEGVLVAAIIWLFTWLLPNDSARIVGGVILALAGLTFYFRQWIIARPWALAVSTALVVSAIVSGAIAWVHFDISSKWTLRGASDCGDTDVGAPTSSSLPQDARCGVKDTKGQPVVTAVCWDGRAFLAAGAPSCTYKTTPWQQCTGGKTSGLIYSCQP